MAFSCKAQVFRSYYDRLSKALKPVVGEFAGKAFSKNLISQECRSSADNLLLGDQYRARKLLDQIYNKFEENEIHCDTFVALMEDVPLLKDLAKDLKKELSVWKSTRHQLQGTDGNRDTEKESLSEEIAASKKSSKHEIQLQSTEDFNSFSEDLRTMIGDESFNVCTVFSCGTHQVDDTEVDKTCNDYETGMCNGSTSNTSFQSLTTYAADEHKQPINAVNLNCMVSRTSEHFAQCTVAQNIDMCSQHTHNEISYNESADPQCCEKSRNGFSTESKVNCRSVPGALYSKEKSCSESAVVGIEDRSSVQGHDCIELDQIPTCEIKADSGYNVNINESPCRDKSDLYATSRLTEDAKVTDLQGQDNGVLELKCDDVHVDNTGVSCIDSEDTSSPTSSCCEMAKSIDNENDGLCFNLLKDSHVSATLETFEKVQEKIEEWIPGRNASIESLKCIQITIEKSYQKRTISKVSGASAAIVGGSLGVAGFALSFFTFGASLGLSIAGGVLAAAGGITMGGADIGDWVKCRSQLRKAKEIYKQDLNISRELCELAEKLTLQVSQLSLKHQESEETILDFISKIFKGQKYHRISNALYNGFKLTDAAVGLGIEGVKIGRSVASIGSGTQATARLVWTGLTSVAGGFSVAGVVFDSVIIPFDFFVLVKGSYDIHKYRSGNGSNSHRAKKVKKMINDLEKGRGKVLQLQTHLLRE